MIFREQSTAIAKGKSVSGGESVLDSNKPTQALTMMCWGCDQLSHLRRDCPDPGKKTSKCYNSA